MARDRSYDRSYRKRSKKHKKSSRRRRHHRRSPSSSSSSSVDSCRSRERHPFVGRRYYSRSRSISDKRSEERSRSRHQSLRHDSERSRRSRDDSSSPDTSPRHVSRRPRRSLHEKSLAHNTEEQSLTPKDTPTENTSAKNTTTADVVPITVTNETSEKILGDDILNIIGERIAEERALAPPMHSSLVVRWSEIVKLGLPTDVREAIIKKYPPPENCLFMDPPKINSEASRAVSDIARDRDKRIVAKQAKISACGAALGKILTALVQKNNDKNNLSEEDKVYIETLSDASRLIMDVLHDESMIRRSLIMANVKPGVKETLKTAPIDECLFGNKLSDELKAAELVEQSAEKMKIVKNIPQKSSKNFKGPTRPQVNKLNATAWSSGPKQTAPYQHRVKNNRYQNTERRGRSRSQTRQNRRDNLNRRTNSNRR